MKTIPAAVLAALACGCAPVTPNYDAHFGAALRQAKLAMTLHPGAGKTGDPATGLDGRAAREAVERYQASFKDPPPATTVVNIGGPIGTAKGSNQ